MDYKSVLQQLSDFDAHRSPMKTATMTAGLLCIMFIFGFWSEALLMLIGFFLGGGQSVIAALRRRRASFRDESA